MNKNSYLIILLTLVIGVISCKKDEVTPTAAFDYQSDKLKVTFSNNSKDASKYSWDFGDGKSSTEKDPTHTYASNGTYKVTLKATNDSKSASTSKDILVNDGVDTGVQLGFNSSIDYLSVTFSNTSLNADTYSWDFGDGKSSTEKNPTHAYIKNGTYTVKLTGSNTEGSKTIEKEISVTSQYKQSGFFIASVASSSAGSTYYGGHYDQLSPEIDLTAKVGYQRINIIASRNGFMYGWRTSNEAGLVKLAIDATTGELEEVGELDIDYWPGSMAFVNDELAYITAFASKEIKYFNPVTMSDLKDVDLSSAFSTDGYDNAGYSGGYYNPNTGKMYFVAFANNDNTPPFYDLDKVYVEVVDAATGVWEKSISHDNALYCSMRGQVNTITDSEGNLYLLAQGTYGLDNQIGPTAAPGSRPQILKINTNSEFDESFAYNPINELGFTNNFFQLGTNMVGTNSDIAYLIGTAKPDASEILALLAKLAAGTITQDEMTQLRGLVLYDESMKILEIDLSSKSVRMVENAPLTAGFGYPSMYNYNGNIYSLMVSNGGTFNGVYKIDPSNNTAEPVVNVKAGGICIDFVDLSASF